MYDPFQDRVGEVGFLAGGVGEARLLLNTQSEFPDYSPVAFGLRQLAAVEKNPRAMFVVVRHESALVGR